MASKRNVRRTTCQRKRAHATAEQARAAALAMDRRHPGNTAVAWYRCRFNGAHWHVGHDPARVRAFVADARRAG